MSEPIDTQAPAQESDKPERTCGVIMPISASEGYPAEHWADILRLIKEAAYEAEFDCDMVSAIGQADIIHASIVTNIYKNTITVCDVSSRNPNVMLELGLRLASSMPVIIIFDGQGSYPFDINAFRYIRYRQDMRYYDTQVFKKELKEKMLALYDAYKKGQYHSFLSHYKVVDVKIEKLATETQPLEEFLKGINAELADIKGKLSSSSQLSTEIADYIDPTVLHTYFSTKLRAMDLHAPLTSAEIDSLGDMLRSRYRKEFSNAPLSMLYTIVDTMVNPYLRSQGRIKP